ncbi:enoyl-CoA hydratase/isomerase family protein (plasmid) [Mesorhizobium sp. ORM8.1]
MTILGQGLIPLRVCVPNPVPSTPSGLRIALYVHCSVSIAVGAFFKACSLRERDWSGLDVLLSIDDHIACMTINREHRRNAFDMATTKLFLDCLLEVRRSDASILVVSGKGTKAFSAGMDIKAGSTYTKRELEDYARIMLTCRETLDELPCATIAAIEGFCLGGGLELALGCDLRIASEAARFGFPEVRLGVLPSGGGTVRAPRAIGMARAREMLIFGEQIDARKALDWGLVNRLVPAETALQAALDYAATYGDTVNRQTVSILKDILVSGQGASTRVGQTLAFLGDCALMGSSEYKAGMASLNKPKS